MTLITFYANQEFAVVAADRWLIYPNQTLKEKDRTKLLAWTAGVVFGFTGPEVLAEGRAHIPTLEWLAKRILEHEATGTLDCDVLADTLNQQRFRNVADKRLAFGGVGFFNRTDPRWILITNMHNEDGSVSDSALPSFRSSVSKFEGELFTTLGNQLSPSAKHMLDEGMPSARSNPDAVSHLLAGAIEKSASKRVGEQALVVILRRSKGYSFEVVTPGRNRPGITVDIASPLLVGNGGIVAMPPQQMRRSPRVS